MRQPYRLGELTGGEECPGGACLDPPGRLGAAGSDSGFDARGHTDRATYDTSTVMSREYQAALYAHYGRDYVEQRAADWRVSHEGIEYHGS